MRKTVFVTRQIPEKGMALLRAKGYRVVVGSRTRNLLKAEIMKKGKGVHGLVALLSDSVDGEVMDAIGPQLRVVANYAVGYDNIDIAAAKTRGVRVGNTPDVLSDAVGEYAAALALGIARRLAEADRFVREGKFAGWAPDLLLGTQLRGKIAGIVGCGRIGTAAARIFIRGFGMKVVYADPKRNREAEKKVGMVFRSFENLLREADVISLHIPLLDSTRHLIGPKEFRKMKKTALLVNTSRGAVIDERALVLALSRKEIAGAALDVFEQEPELSPGLLKLNNVLLAPHIGSATREARDVMAEMTARNVISVLSGGKPFSLVV